MKHNHFETIIIGGSYAGLSAALALGRSLRKTLIIDNGQPCNRQTPNSHNFLTRDGIPPQEIANKARAEVGQYRTIQFHQGLATAGVKTDFGFEVTTNDNTTYSTQKLVLATGIRDLLPEIDGMAACWGISVIHCPYCHGYEVRNQKTGILGNGDYGFEFSKMIRHWTEDLTLFTNGISSLLPEQTNLLRQHNIRIVEKQVAQLQQEKGHLQSIVFEDGSKEALKALYTKAPFEQSCSIPIALGCALTEEGYIEVDAMQKTSVPGIYACGDNTTMKRSVANAVAMGNTVGAVLNKELIEEKFLKA